MRRIDSFFVGRMNVIQNVDRSNTASLEIRRQFVKRFPIVLTALRLGILPGKIHADEFETSRCDHIEVFRRTGYEMDIYTDAGGNRRGRDLRNRSGRHESQTN